MGAELVDGGASLGLHKKAFPFPWICAQPDSMCWRGPGTWSSLLLQAVGKVGQLEGAGTSGR